MKNNSFWGRLKAALITFLKDTFVKTALKKLLGAAASGGVKTWIIKYIATELFEEVAEPIMKATFRKVGYIYEVSKGEHILKKVKNAKDSDSWHDATGSV